MFYIKRLSRDGAGIGMFLNRTWLNYIIRCDRNNFMCLEPRSSSIELKSKYMALAIAYKFSRRINWESTDQLGED